MMLASFVPKIALGAALLGATAGAIGALAVLRRRSLMGDVIAHSALPGICLAYLIFNTRSLPVLSVGALVTGVAAVAAIAAATRWTRTREDAAMGIVLASFFGAGVVLLTVVQQQGRGNQAGLATYLFGEIAALRSQDVTLIAVVGVGLLALLLLFYKEVKTLAFDRQFAQSQGWPTLALDLGMMSAVAVVTVIGLPVCGVVLMAAMLIQPCVSARYWSHRLGHVLTASALFGALAALGGVLAAAPGEVLDKLPLRSWTLGMPPGPLIVLAGAALLLLSVILAPERGVVARTLRLTALRLRIATDHVLRLLFETVEPDLPALPPVPLHAIINRMSANTLTKWTVVRMAIARGLLEKVSPGEVALTTAGLQAAARLVRTHRLWERFLVEHADIAADHVHRSADDIEHMLPEPLVDALEAQLAAEGRLPRIPADQAVPQSPHEIQPPRGPAQ